jgi:hypothetical protein
MAEAARPIEVLHDGSWYPGMLDRWKHDERGWVGHVWWSEGVGLTHVEWIAAARLRPKDQAG